MVSAMMCVCWWVSYYGVIADEEQAMCLAIALSIQDTAAVSASAVRPGTSNAADSCSCTPYLSAEQETVDRVEMLSSLNSSSHKLSAAPCSSYEFPRSSHDAAANIESVFEPRPPHPGLSSPLLSTRGTGPKQRCALAHDETVTVLDPWRRRPSSLDHGRHRSHHCTRPTDGCLAKKSKSGSRRRRSCGNHLPHRSNPPSDVAVGYLSDRTVSPVTTGSTERGRSRDLTHQTLADSLELVISSDILESMLQGAEGYCASAAEAAAATVGQTEAASGCTDDSKTDNNTEDSDSVFL